MRMIIIGAGFTGVQLARELIREKHRVTLIDSDADRVRDIGAQLDCSVVHSEGNSLDVLEEAGIASADALVAVTASDEVNMIACSLADSVYPNVVKIARVRNYAYWTDTEAAFRRYAEKFSGERRPPFGIDWMVNPDVEAARVLSRTLVHGAVGGILELGHGAGIVTLTVGGASPLAGKRLAQLPSVEGWNYLVAYIEKESGAVLPSGGSVIEAGDRIGVLVPLDLIEPVAALCDASSSAVSRLLIVGAGSVGGLIVSGQRTASGASLFGRLAGAVLKGPSRMEITVVDGTYDRCRSMVEHFRDVKVLCGDATDINLIREESLDSCDLALAVSENFERNLITAAYLKSCGVKRTVALTSITDASEMAKKLGVDVAIPMRSTVVDSIMSHLRGKNVSAVHTVCGGEFEIVECTVAEKSHAAGRLLRDLDLKGAALVLTVRNGEGVGLRPSGNTLLSPGDELALLISANDRSVTRVFTNG